MNQMRFLEDYDAFFAAKNGSVPNAAFSDVVSPFSTIFSKSALKSESKTKKHGPFYKKKRFLT
jgi:hypothetical protein